jgi:hypothetical protein
MTSQDDPEALAKISKLIAASFIMYSGCMDDQTSADVSSVSSFRLPDPAGASGGALSSALLSILYSRPSPTFQQLLMDMREDLKKGRFSQIPQLSSSRPVHIKETPFYIVPDNFNGTRRVVMIGINYVGQQVSSACRSKACHKLR